jgi:hypothetical protein
MVPHAGPHLKDYLQWRKQANDPHIRTDDLEHKEGQ